MFEKKINSCYVLIPKYEEQIKVHMYRKCVKFMMKKFAFKYEIKKGNLSFKQRWLYSFKIIFVLVCFILFRMEGNAVWWSTG